MNLSSGWDLQCLCSTSNTRGWQLLGITPLAFRYYREEDSYRLPKEHWKILNTFRIGVGSCHFKSRPWKGKKTFKWCKINTHGRQDCACVPGDSSRSGNTHRHTTTSCKALLDLNSEEPLIYNSFFRLVWDRLVGFYCASFDAWK